MPQGRAVSARTEEGRDLGPYCRCSGLSQSETVELEEKVVVGVDGSPDSLAALDWAAVFAESFGLELNVVVAWHVPTLYRSPAPEADLEAAAGGVARRAVTRVQEDHPGLAVTRDVVNDSPGKALVAASKTAALLVVGTRRELGSVSSFCSHYATCPVTIVRDMPAKGA